MSFRIIVTQTTDAGAVGITITSPAQLVATAEVEVFRQSFPDLDLPRLVRELNRPTRKKRTTKTEAK